MQNRQILKVFFTLKINIQEGGEEEQLYVGNIRGVWTDLEMQSVSVILWATSFFGQKLSVSEDDPLFTGLGVDKIDQSQGVSIQSQTMQDRP